MDDASESASTYYTKKANGALNWLFSSCQDDPRGSVHRAWGVSLIFVLIYFVLSVVEMINLQSNGGSKALVVGSVWTGIVHLVLGIVGTFVLKRFPTSFSVGFFLGTLVVFANQNLILFGTFHGYSYGNTSTNHIFSNVGFTLFCILTFFALLLFHFKDSIVVAPIDAKGLGGRKTVDSGSDYRQYDDADES